MIAAFVVAVLLGIGCVCLFVRLKQVESDRDERLARAREANEQLAAHAANNQQKLKALSESSGAGMVVLDQAGRVVHANSAAERILNSGEDKLVGHSLIQATLSTELQAFI